MNIPDNLKYTKEHEWVRLEGDVAVVGITDFAQGELGDIVFVEVETVDGVDPTSNLVSNPLQAGLRAAVVYVPMDQQPGRLGHDDPAFRFSEYREG